MGDESDPLISMNRSSRGRLSLEGEFSPILWNLRHLTDITASDHCSLLKGGSGKPGEGKKQTWDASARSWLRKTSK